MATGHQQLLSTGEFALVLSSLILHLPLKLTLPLHLKQIRMFLMLILKQYGTCSILWPNVLAAAWRISSHGFTLAQQQTPLTDYNKLSLFLTTYYYAAGSRLSHFKAVLSLHRFEFIHLIMY